MKKIRVTVPGGETVEAAPGTRAGDIGAPGAAAPDGRRIVAAAVDGAAVDLARPVTEDCSVEWVPLDSPEGIGILRHSTAHLMAQAVQSLFPGTQVTIGPTTRRASTTTSSATSRSRRRDREDRGTDARTGGQDLSIAREELSKAEAIELFRGMGEDYKVEILSAIPEDTVSLYRQGDWVDLCRGPQSAQHRLHPGLQAHLGGRAYWRGDEKNEMSSASTAPRSRPERS